MLNDFKKINDSANFNYLIGSEQEVRFFFIRVQSLLAILLVFPLVFLRFYHQDYSTGFIDICIVFVVLFINFILHKNNKEKYSLFLIYFIPAFYSMISLVSIYLNEAENFILIYAVCFVFFFLIKPIGAIFSSLVFITLYFLVSHTYFSDYDNSKIIVSYLLISFILSMLTMQVQKDRERAKKLARYDPVVRARNQQVLYEDVRRFIHIKSLPNFKNGIYMLLIDIDDFKKLNEKYGFFFGDLSLIALKKCLENLLSVTDTLYYYGSDKFIIISEKPETDILLFTETACRTVRESKLHKQSKVSVSIGVKKLEAEQDFNDWFDGTEKALKQAKASGKNTVCFAQ